MEGCNEEVKGRGNRVRERKDVGKSGGLSEVLLEQ